MARQRVLKPSFNDDDDMAAISLEGRLFYALIWGWLDKQSLVEENPLALRSKLFPREDFPVSKIVGWIEELVRPGPSGRPRLIRLAWRGKPLLYCPTLKRHSRIFHDEPESFKVPEAVLKEARETMGVFIDERGNAVDPSNPQGPSALPPASDETSTEDPRGSHAEPTNSHDSSSSSVPASVSASSSASAPAFAAGTKIPPGLRVVENHADGPGSGTESCALCFGSGILRRVKRKDGLPYDFRCLCPAGKKAGSDRWPFWNLELEPDYVPPVEESSSQGPEARAGPG